MDTNWCTLNIDENEMWATLSLKHPEGEETIQISAEYIENFIKSQGINSGLNSNAIEMLANELRYGQEITVAQGKPPINGNDGYFNFTIPVEDVKSKPVINEDGSVDYYNSLKLAEVREGELFATYIPPTKGEYGHTIFSKLLAPIPGKPLAPLRGKGFITNEDKSEYRALFDGHIIKDDMHITIEKLYIVSGDLDLDKGNINFNGDVEITGDVRSGLSITSGGNVFIHGHVGGCDITAKKNITIQKGIQGRDRCYITAGGDVICKFVERCSISAEGSIFADSILDSIVSAQNTVQVVSKSGIVIGGKIHGTLGITTKEAGNSYGNATLLTAGVSRDEIQRSVELSEMIEKYDNDLSTLIRQYDSFNNLKPGKNPKKITELKNRIMRAKVLISSNRKTASDELSKLNYKINQARKNSFIHVTGISHAGVKICINECRYTVDESFKDVIYRCVNNEIVAEGGE